MAVQTRRYTIDEFEAVVNAPENADRLFEFIGEEIVEVPSKPYSSQVAAFIIAALIMYLKSNPIGHVTGEAGGYQIGDERYARTKQDKLPHEGYNPNPPDLAVEVISPSDTDRQLRIKVTNYLAAGTVVWVVDPGAKEVEVYRPGQVVQIIAEDGTLDGGELLPGFLLAVNEIFPE